MTNILKGGGRNIIRVDLTTDQGRFMACSHSYER